MCCGRRGGDARRQTRSPTRTRQHTHAHCHRARLVVSSTSAPRCRSSSSNGTSHTYYHITSCHVKRNATRAHSQVELLRAVRALDLNSGGACRSNDMTSRYITFTLQKLGGARACAALSRPLVRRAPRRLRATDNPRVASRRVASRRRAVSLTRARATAVVSAPPDDAIRFSRGTFLGQFGAGPGGTPKGYLDDEVIHPSSAFLPNGLSGQAYGFVCVRTVVRTLKFSSRSREEKKGLEKRSIRSGIIESRKADPSRDDDMRVCVASLAALSSTLKETKRSNRWRRGGALSTTRDGARRLAMPDVRCVHARGGRRHKLVLLL